MRKFSDSEIYQAGIGSLKSLRDIMKNQNDIIDFFHHMDSISIPIFAEWEKKKSEVTNSTG